MRLLRANDSVEVESERTSSFSVRVYSGVDWRVSHKYSSGSSPKRVPIKVTRVNALIVVPTPNGTIAAMTNVLHFGATRSLCVRGGTHPFPPPPESHFASGVVHV